jgi:L-alanine-DL-glutamate epimerase-like enolase superfamily enzyme
MNNFSIDSYEYFQIPAGWRKWLILSITSKDGLVGFAEFTDSNGSEATLLTAIEEIGELLVGKRIISIEEIVLNLRKKYRQSLPGIMFKAISAFENALWDLQSKNSGNSITRLLSRDQHNSQSQKFKCYWSHCPTTRIRSAEHISADPIFTFNDLKLLGDQILANGFPAFKTNLVQIKPIPKVLMPGFNKNFLFDTEIIPDSYPKELKSILKAIVNDSEKLEVIIDMNFNVNLDKFNSIQNEISDFNVRWIEIDFDDFFLYEEILKVKKYPLCTGENLLGLNSFEKIIYDKRVDIISIDVLWNGLTESLKIAELAISLGKKIAVHNYYGSLATSMALVFLSMIPADSVELMEYDFDDVPWRDSIVSNPPKLLDGTVEYILGKGWNNDFVPTTL